jgi:hypothetical protein
MLTFVICFLFGANPDVWLPDSEFDKRYCRPCLITLAVTQRQLNAINELMTRNPGLANDERLILAARRNEKLLQQCARELEIERAEQKLRLLFPPSRDRNGRPR